MLEAQIRNETAELRLLLEVIQALEGATDISGNLKTILELMAKYTGMMRGTLALLGSDVLDAPGGATAPDEPGNSEIAVTEAYGLNDSEVERGHYKLGEGITGKVVQTGKAMVVPRVSQEPMFLNRTGARDLNKEEVSFICVPILLDGRAVGALSADRLFADSVCLEEDMRLLQVLASLIAKAVRTRREFSAMHSAVVEENRRLQSLVRGNLNLDNMIGSSTAMNSVIEELVQVSASNATVLIRGESGTGKEMIAGIIHANGARAGRPFVKVNCAALPEGLVESELFGYERGAFTGAVQSRKGRFEMAHGGTLFLDEVGDMTPLTQAKLLRALQEKEFERVGGTETLRVDVRLIAATNRDLEDMAAKGLFRQDLYYRLSVFPIILPPLRKRKDDLMSLAAHFIDKVCAGNGKKILSIAPRAVARLLAYDWPGNIRELENVIERAVILSGADGVIDLPQLPLWLQGQGVAATPVTRGTASPTGAGSAAVTAGMGEVAETAGIDGVTEAGTDEAGGPAGAIQTGGGLFAPSAEAGEAGAATLEETLNSVEKSLILESLRLCRGNLVKAARRLGITERIMGLRMKKYGLDYRRFR